MNPGPIETGGEVAKETVHALSTSPLILGTMVLQIITLGILAWWAHERNQYETGVNQAFAAVIEQLMKQCGPSQRGELEQVPLPLPFPAEVPRG